MKTKTFPITPEERLLLEEMHFGIDESGYYAEIARKLSPDEYALLGRVLEAMKAKYSNYEKRHRFKAGYDPFEMLARKDENVLEIASDGFFATPEAAAKAALRLLEAEPGLTYLEPSAGTGALCFALERVGVSPASICVLETNARRREYLASHGYVVLGSDFLVHDFQGAKFERIFMNPPFELNADVKHVLKARQLLAPAGVLVSIVSGAAEWKDEYAPLRALVTRVERLHKNAFKEAGATTETLVIQIKDGAPPDPNAFKQIEREVEVKEIEYPSPLEIIEELEQLEEEYRASLAELRRMLTETLKPETAAELLEILDGGQIKMF
jgi:SAM-dependent methyltransferase